MVGKRCKKEFGWVTPNYVPISVIVSKMKERLPYFKLCSFLFGTRPTLLLATFGVAAFSLPAIFTLSPAGSVESSIKPRHTLWALGATAFLLLLTGIVIRSNSKSTYSPFLHRKIAPFLITGIYVVLVGVITAIATFLYFRFVQKPVPLERPELAVWSTLVSLYGLIVVLQITVRNFEPPGNQQKVGELISEILENRSSAEDCSNYNAFLEPIEERLEDISEELNNATTPGGKELARDTEELVEKYRSIPTDVQIIVVDSSRSPADKELSDLKIQFESVTERLNRIS